TNYLQYKIISLLSGKHKNISVVGDDNQSIYGWRGADITNILNFENDFPEAKVLKLEMNYRSTKNILRAANSVIHRNRFRSDKRLWTKNPEGDPIIYYEASDEKDEAKNVASQIKSEMNENGRSFKDIAVFYRTNNQSRLIEEELLNLGIPYTIVGGVSFYERTEIKDIIAYLRLIANLSDDISLRRIINVPRRGIGKGTIEVINKLAKENDISLYDALILTIKNKSVSNKTLKNLEKFSELISNLEQLSKNLTIRKLVLKVLEYTKYIESLKNDDERRENIGEILNLISEFEKEKKGSTLIDFLDWISLSTEVDRFNGKANQVALMTLHCAKGLEFPVVFVIGMEEKLFPHVRSIGDGKLIEEERRLCYVGITRAKQKLYLTSTSKRKVFGIEQRSIPSRFITEIPRNLLQWRSYQQSPKDKYSVSLRQKLTSEKNGDGLVDNPFVLGERVLHHSFGRGVVTNIEGKGDETKVVILFPNHGKKKILARFQGLKKI
ncbi:MAG: ATP-dependent helicase, partial [Thermodesulfobacteriota bacterium]